MQNENIMVSITCTTYNQEGYIAQALDSFLMQKTDFPFEIIVHDDASTDRTPEIMRQYEEKYPDKFICVYQEKNQYSQGISSDRSVFPHIRGKYRAFCEGDDYWTDPHKLQKQVDYMEAHPDCSMCVHSAHLILADGADTGKLDRPATGDRDYTAEEVIASGERLFQSATMFQRTEYLRELPDFYRNAPVGDLPYQIYFAMRGYIHYMDEPMSVYRQNAKGSWTNRTFSSLAAQAALSRRLRTMYEEADEYSGHRYAASIQKAIDKCDLQIALNTGDVARVRQMRRTMDRSNIHGNLLRGLEHPALYTAYVRLRAMVRKLKYIHK